MIGQETQQLSVDYFNISGHGNDSESCHFEQVWARDLGGDGDWVLVDEVIARLDSKWESRFVDPANFKGPKIEIRAVGWRKSFGNEKNNPPLSYLAGARGVTAVLED